MRKFSALLLWVLGLGPAAAHTLNVSHAHAAISVDQVFALLLVAGVLFLAIRRIK